MYLYIEYTEELEMVLLSILENMDSDSYEELQENYLIQGVLDKYKNDKFVKAKVDIYKFGPSFFQQAEEGKKGKKGMKNLLYEEFLYVTITKGVLSLKTGGVWRKDNSPDSGFSISVLAVLVKVLKNHVEEEEENDDKAFTELLQSKSKKMNNKLVVFLIYFLFVYHITHYICTTCDMIVYLYDDSIFLKWGTRYIEFVKSTPIFSFISQTI